MKQVPLLLAAIVFLLLHAANTFVAAVKETKYYDLLEISPKDFDPNKLRSAYAKMAKKYHPDKNPNNREEAQKKFLEISEGNLYPIICCVCVCL